MRISEKTIELTFAAQCGWFGDWRARNGRWLDGPPIWFGLTQNQEARLGFDACTRMNAALMLFQFKASRNGTSNLRKFVAPHDQLQTLQLLAGTFQSLNIFYVFPRIEDTIELDGNPDLLGQCRLINVRTLPNPMPLPTNRDGSIRRSFSHHVELELATNRITFWSDPVEVESQNAREYLFEPRREFRPVSAEDKSRIFALVGAFTGASLGVLLPI